MDAENLTTITSNILGSSANKDKVTEGIRFLLSHFQIAGQQLFPRKMSSAISDGRQFTVLNNEQILQECEKANNIDCRLNAYPLLDDGVIMAPTIIFIDIDGISKLESDKILKRTLKIIKTRLNGYVPTVLWTGNGYHLYLVIDTIALELMHELSRLSREPSKLFLRFAESFLSNGKSDGQHRSSFKSCLLRIPGTLNSKCIIRKVDPEVKIVKDSQAKVPLMGTSLLREFRLHLADIEFKSKIELQKKFNNKYFPSRTQSFQGYEWIEKLLQTPIADYRKCTIDLVLAPYLIVIKNYRDKEAFAKIKYWIQECDNIRPLLPSLQYFDCKISEAVRKTLAKRIPPISLSNLKHKYPSWFENLEIVKVV